MTGHRFVPLTFLALVVLTEMAHGQSVDCKDDITVRQCMDKVDRGRFARDTADGSVKKKVAGVALPGSKIISIQDFLPRLATALYTPGLESLDSLGTSVNIPLSHKGPATLQIGVILFKPTLYKPLLDAVPRQRRDSVRSRLKEDLGELDQPRITAALNVESKSRGRKFSVHADDISRLFLEVDSMVNVSLEKMGLLQDADFLVVLARYKRAGFATTEACANVEDVVDAPLSCFTGVWRDSVRAAAARTAGSDTAAAMTGRLIEQFGLLRVADLVNNQPQLILNVRHDPLHWSVGPTQTHVEFRYETGDANMNDLRKTCGGTVRLECFRTFMSKAGTSSGLVQNRRFVFTLSGDYQPEYDARFEPEDQASLTLPSGWKWEGSIGYGRYLGTTSGSIQNTRFDIVALGSSQKEDGIREPNRITASATFTQRVSDHFTGSVGLLWANKPEFLDEDVKRIGANLGVRYKTIDKKDK